MVEIDTVVVKVASRCNIDCRYCYVFNMGDTNWSRSPKQMSHETCHATASALAEVALEQKLPFAVVLHGGEPLLLGAANLDYLISTFRTVLPNEGYSNLVNRLRPVLNEAFKGLDQRREYGLRIRFAELLIENL